MITDLGDRVLNVDGVVVVPTEAVGVRPGEAGRYGGVGLNRFQHADVLEGRKDRGRDGGKDEGREGEFDEASTSWRRVRWRR